jgi:hypothetical protein
MAGKCGKITPQVKLKYKEIINARQLRSRAAAEEKIPARPLLGGVFARKRRTSMA